MYMLRMPRKGNLQARHSVPPGKSSLSVAPPVRGRQQAWQSKIKAFYSFFVFINKINTKRIGNGHEEFVVVICLGVCIVQIITGFVFWD